MRVKIHPCERPAGLKAATAGDAVQSAVGGRSGGKVDGLEYAGLETDLGYFAGSG